MDDREILALFLERSERAIDELSKKYGAVLQRTARNILQNQQDAEECVSDSLLAVWNTVPPKEPDPLLTYAARITRNLAISRRRAQTAAKRAGDYDLALEELAESLADRVTLEDALAARELTDALNGFLATLDRESRVLFLRRYWYGDSVGELAAALGLRQNTVSVRLLRLRDKLKNYLTKEGIAV